MKVFSIYGTEITGYTYGKTIKWSPCLIQFTKINSGGFQDKMFKAKLCFLECRKIFSLPQCREEFLKKQHQVQMERTDKFDHITTTNCSSKDTKESGKTSQDWRKYLSH